MEIPGGGQRRHSRTSVPTVAGVDRLPAEAFELIVDGVRWTFDADFLTSSWECIWGRGCQGIEDEGDEASQLGCCSVGAQLLDDDEARLTAALGSSLDPRLFERHALAEEIGVLDESGLHTRVLAGRCIFHNSVDFPGGAGCALHLSALAEGEDPLDWKPGVCWQLPLKVDRSAQHRTAHLRAWQRGDWGPGGQTMAWCCSSRDEAPEAFAGPEPVFVSLADELKALLGAEGYDALAERLDQDPRSGDTTGSSAST